MIDLITFALLKQEKVVVDLTDSVIDINQQTNGDAIIPGDLMTALITAVETGNFTNIVVKENKTMPTTVCCIGVVDARNVTDDTSIFLSFANNITLIINQKENLISY